MPFVDFNTIIFSDSLSEVLLCSQWHASWSADHLGGIQEMTFLPVVNVFAPWFGTPALEHYMQNPFLSITFIIDAQWKSLDSFATMALGYRIRLSYLLAEWGAVCPLGNTSSCIFGEMLLLK